MKIIFMGTPEFAVPSLEKLNQKHEIIAVYTKVDKVNSRGNKINYTPVKQFALENNLKIVQPKNFKEEDTISKIKEMNPDLIVVVAYGKILPKSLLEIPKFGAINVHSSLLPKYRGAAPINAAIINGEKKTGVSIMEIVEELDAGAVFAKKELDIEEDDDFLSLHDKLKKLGSDLLIEVIANIEEGNVTKIKQDESKVTFVKPFSKNDLKIDWNMTSREIFNFVRGLSPLPCSYTFLDNKLLKIYEVKIYDKVYNGQVGEVVDIAKKQGFVVKTKDTSVVLTKLKPENKKILSGNDTINGKILKLGDTLC